MLTGRKPPRKLKPQSAMVLSHRVTTNSLVGPLKFLFSGGQGHGSGSAAMR